MGRSHVTGARHYSLNRNIFDAVPYIIFAYPFLWARHNIGDRISVGAQGQRIHNIRISTQISLAVPRQNIGDRIPTGQSISHVVGVGFPTVNPTYGIRFSLLCFMISLTSGLPVDGRIQALGE